MNIIQEAFQRLYPDKKFEYETEINYNLRLSKFNSNIKLFHNKLTLNLNLEWKDIDDEIKIGLAQTLILKIFAQKYIPYSKNTTNILLYNNFVKNIPMLTPKIEGDILLENSFKRVNEKFFSSSIEKPNLRWGNSATRRIASYNFHSDTVTVSNIFQTASERVIDYLMYHEILHKHHKFKNKNGRSFYHTNLFREDENNYPDKNLVDQEINTLLVKFKRKSPLQSIFELFK